ncbi:MAG: VCBS repeat-containing protein, partial [Deltaproteobacteria bacterium]
MRAALGIETEPDLVSQEGIGATPALGDLDGDGKLEIVAGSVDQKLYVWHSNGTRMAPFPIQLFDASSTSGVSAFAPKAIISSA